MNPATRRDALIVLGLAASTGVLAHVGKPSIKLADREPELKLADVIPVQFAGWRIDPASAVILPAPDVQAKLDAIYNQVLSRTYVNDRGVRIMLSIAYGGDQSDGTSIHLPEVCYPAQGFEVRSKRAGFITVEGRRLPVRQLMTDLGMRREPVTYWITIGDQVAPSRTDQKLIQIRYGLRGLIPDGMLVRLSSIDPEPERAWRLHETFAAEMGAALPHAIRDRMIGRKPD
jgi:EpsI family protein